MSRCPKCRAPRAEAPVDPLTLTATPCCTSCGWSATLRDMGVQPQPKVYHPGDHRTKPMARDPFKPMSDERKAVLTEAMKEAKAHKAKMAEPRTCRMCGAEFTPKAENARYCSPACYQLSRNERKLAARRPNADPVRSAAAIKASETKRINAATRKRAEHGEARRVAELARMAGVAA